MAFSTWKKKFLFRITSFFDTINHSWPNFFIVYSKFGVSTLRVVKLWENGTCFMRYENMPKKRSHTLANWTDYNVFDIPESLSHFILNQSSELNCSFSEDKFNVKNKGLKLILKPKNWSNKKMHRKKKNTMHVCVWINRKKQLSHHTYYMTVTCK